VSTKAGLATQVRRGMRGAHRAQGIARRLQLRSIHGSIHQALTYPSSKRLASFDPHHVEVRAGMHDVRLLRVDQISIQHRAWGIRESDIQANVEILLVLILVYDHLILQF